MLRDLPWEVSSHQLWDRLWLNDSSEAHVREGISPWAGVPQRDGVKLAQSSYPLPSYFLDPPMFSSITYWPPLSRAMIYPQLVQPPAPVSPLHFTLLTPHHNLLCHPDLPALSHSKQNTTHGWRQRSQDVSCPLVHFAPDQVKASGPPAWGQSPPSSRPPLLCPTPWSFLLCGQPKHFSSWAKASKCGTLHWICGIPKHLSELCSFTMSKAMFALV